MTFSDQKGKDHACNLDGSCISFLVLRSECAEHAVQCFVRLVRVLLGDSAISDKKVEWGESFTVLGVSIEMQSQGFTYRPSQEKIVKWIACMNIVLVKNTLYPDY